MTLTLHPLDLEAPPDGLVSLDDLRGIAIHWRAAQTATSSPPKRRTRKKAATPWHVQRIAFHAVSPRREDVPPRGAAETQRFVLAAYAIAASRHPIPSDAEVYYEVRS